MRKRHTHWVLVLLILAMTSPVFAAPIEAARIRVIDGDTVAVDGQHPHYRLVGFNAADLGQGACRREQAFSYIAKGWLMLLIEDAKEITLSRVACACREGTEGTQACNRGRLCAVLKVDGMDVGESLIKIGAATPLRCGARDCPPLSRPWCKP